jgi:predicted negative regulator of RcsB-dependent stress response
MAQPRFRRKDLKRPDEFVSAGRNLIEWARTNSTRVYQGATALAIALIAVAGFYSLQGAQTRQANDDLTEALVPLRAGNFSQASTQLADVGNRWESKQPGQIAKLFAADASLRASDYAAASVLLEHVADTSSLPEYLRQQARVNLAFAREQRGDVKQAAQDYADAAAVQGPYTAVAVLGEARCRESLGDAKGARQLYERFAREYPEAAETERVNVKLDQLQG